MVGTLNSRPWRYCADVAGGDPRQLEAAALDPGEKLLDGVQVVLAGVGVGDLGLEELLPGELGGAAGGLDDRRRVAGGDRLAPGRQPGLVRPLIDDDLALRIGSFLMPPLLRNLMIDNALCLSVRRVSFRSSPVQQVESLGQRDRVNRYTGGRKAEREEAIGSS